MNRKELYAQMKKLGVVESFNKKYGYNYTNATNAKLEAFLNGFKKPTKKSTCSCKEAVIKLVSTLQSIKVLKPREAEEIVALL